MTTEDWHASVTLVERYVAGQLDPAAAWSVEQHVASCHECRARIASPAAEHQLPAARLDGIWAEVEATLDAPAPRPVERLLLALGVPDHVARLLAATPSLTVPWLVAVAAVLGGTAAVARLDAGPLLFLTVAPLVPLAGVALAFGRWGDPTHEVAVAAPVSSGFLLLVRAAAVAGTSFGLAAMAALLLPGLGWMAAAWVLPALAVTAALLAASTWWSPVTSAVVVGVTWVTCVVVGAAWTASSYASFGAAGQGLAATMVGVSAGVFLMRRERLDGGQPA